MERVKFNQDEIKNAKIIEGRSGKQVRFDTPISPRENALLVYRKEKPLWMPGLTMEANPINLDFYLDNLCRTPAEGKDIFGIEWQYVEKVGGGIVRPGDPTVKDINRWEDFVTLPDVDSWDWAGCYERNKENLDPTLLNRVTILTGFFERLISFMDFENAAVAMVDEEQQEGVHRLFDYLVGVYEKFIDNSKKYFKRFKTFEDAFNYRKELEDRYFGKFKYREKELI
jgi:hypothetical protein